MTTEQDTQAEQELVSSTQKLRNDKKSSFHAPVSVQQAATNADRRANGPVWASRTVFPAPKNDALLVAVLEAITGLGDDPKEVHPILADVKVQWSGYRSGAGKKDKEPDISEKAKYEGLMKDTASKTTILYIHGGSYMTGGPANVRPVTTALATLTSGRCLVLDQRLSPQNPFPSAIIDALVAYLSMLYPHKGSFHEHIPSEHIVFAGDSSGGSICLALLLLIQWFQQRNNFCIKFHDNYVSIPYPAGVATLGPQVDITNALPSFKQNARYDFLDDILPCNTDNFPTCPHWPSRPPRANIYTATNLLTHPLVSPITSKSWPSTNPPRLFFAYGQERLLDSGKFTAKQASNTGVSVHFHQYNALPHIFPLLFPHLPQSKHMLTQWANFCRLCVEDTAAVNSSKYCIYEPTSSYFKTLSYDIVNRNSFSDLKYTEVMKLIDEAKNSSWQKVWDGSKSKVSAVL